MLDGVLLRRLTVRGALRVPAVTVYFWGIKALSTAFGESTSDYLVHAMDPVIAVVLGFFVFVLALSLQFFVRRYIAWTYWLAVAAVGVFGTMAADVLHVRFGVPYAVSSVVYAVVLVAVFVVWYSTEKTLWFHTIDTPRREAFYWAAVVATFAMGTAIGDLTAYTFGWGYFASGLMFAGVIMIPAIGYWRLGWNAIFAFWFAYVVTRPLGASFADWLGKPASVGGLGWGSGTVALALATIIFLLVAFLAITRRDVQRVDRDPGVADDGLLAHDRLVGDDRLGKAAGDLSIADRSGHCAEAPAQSHEPTSTERLPWLRPAAASSRAAASSGNAGAAARAANAGAAVLVAAAASCAMPDVGRTLVENDGCSDLGVNTVELSVVVPVYGCADCLTALHRRLTSSLATVTDSYELVFVDDRSRDGGWAVLQDLARVDDRVRAFRLSRNFGQDAAITAGLAQAWGRWAVVMDCDLEEAPEDIPRLWAAAGDGYEVVRTVRHGWRHSAFRRLTSRWYRRLTRETDTRRDYSNLSLLSRRVIDAFLRLRDRDREYMIALDWLGFDSTTVEIEHHARHAGQSGYTLARLVRVALDGMYFRSTVLLRLVVLLGFVVAAAGFGLAVFEVADYFLEPGTTVPGFTSLAVLVLLLAGFIIVSVGVVGLYVGRIFEQVKDRPLFLIDAEARGPERGAGSPPTPAELVASLEPGHSGSGSSES